MYIYGKQQKTYIYIHRKYTTFYNECTTFQSKPTKKPSVLEIQVSDYACNSHDMMEYSSLAVSSSSSHCLPMLKSQQIQIGKCASWINESTEDEPRSHPFGNRPERMRALNLFVDQKNALSRRRSVVVESYILVKHLWQILWMFIFKHHDIRWKFPNSPKNIWLVTVFTLSKSISTTCRICWSKVKAFNQETSPGKNTHLCCDLPRFGRNFAWKELDVFPKKLEQWMTTWCFFFF